MRHVLVLRHTNEFEVPHRPGRLAGGQKAREAVTLRCLRHPRIYRTFVAHDAPEVPAVNAAPERTVLRIGERDSFALHAVLLKLLFPHCYLLPLRFVTLAVLMETLRDAVALLLSHCPVADAPR